ncbi:MAG: nicotinate-nucleotide adenylyltransferase [Deltaproteobacteria bacterium]|jgi:nicotinate-nucleotide adenylyltransferase|nr:nicotinate-nucleotide adenylyltransferase [Deltaproteobacteria bacterium]
MEGQQKIGIMGGTFNPIHFGHLRAVDEMAGHFALQNVYFIPTHIAPHKDSLNMATFQHRFKMIQLGIEGREGFIVTDLESRLSGPSYTVHTLEALHNELGSSVDLFFLVGYDSFRNVDKWFRFRELFKLASFVVNVRASTRGSQEGLGRLLQDFWGESPLWDEKKKAYLLKGINPIYFFKGTKLAISSSDLRKRLIQGQSIRYLVPDKVLDYIFANAVYPFPAENH